MAILLEEEGLYERCRIYATDMNETVLARAEKGDFPLSSMQANTANYLQAAGRGPFSRYYTVKGERAVFEPRLRRNVVFALHNLATDGAFNEFNAVLCRNVLIYFNRGLQDRVHGLLYESLGRFGYLGLGGQGVPARDALRVAVRGASTAAPSSTARSPDREHRGPARGRQGRHPPRRRPAGQAHRPGGDPGRAGPEPGEGAVRQGGPEARPEPGLRGDPPGREHAGHGRVRDGHPHPPAPELGDDAHHLLHRPRRGRVRLRAATRWAPWTSSARPSIPEILRAKVAGLRGPLQEHGAHAAAGRGAAPGAGEELPEAPDRGRRPAQGGAATRPVLLPGRPTCWASWASTGSSSSSTRAGTRPWASRTRSSRPGRSSRSSTTRTARPPPRTSTGCRQRRAGGLLRQPVRLQGRGLSVAGLDGLRLPRGGARLRLRARHHVAEARGGGARAAGARAARRARPPSPRSAGRRSWPR